MNLQKKPHGLALDISYQILKDGKVIKEQTAKSSKLEAYIKVEDLKTRKKIILPMRSFVDGFFDKLHGIITGDTGGDTHLSSVSVGASQTASNVYRKGILLGDSKNPVGFTNTDLTNKIYHDDDAQTGSEAIYKGTTFLPPFVIAVGSDPTNTIQLKFTISRLVTNDESSSWVVNEIGMFAQQVPVTAGASIISDTGIIMLSRDIGEINFSFESNALFSYDFYVNQLAGGDGGLVLNFMKFIYNIMFKGDPNASGLISQSGNTLSNVLYASVTPAAATNAFVIDGSVSEQYVGIVIGHATDNLSAPESEGGESGGENNPDIGGDETTMVINHTGITVTANTVSSITSRTGIKQFTITRDFTLDSTANTIIINRIGLLTRGIADGSTLGTSQVFLAINRPVEGEIVLQPGLTVKIIEKFQITL